MNEYKFFKILIEYGPKTILALGLYFIANNLFSLFAVQPCVALMGKFAAKFWL